MRLDAHVVVERGGHRLDVALAVDDEVVGVVGPNAAGKTTLLEALAGTVRLSAGTIRLDGATLADAASDRHVEPQHRRVGVVAQDVLLFPHLSVLENVAFGPRSRGLRAREARTAARAWLDRVGLDGLDGARPAELSGGQAQRVALARALATDPRLLLLDEPLAALDVATRHRVRRDLHAHLRRFTGPVVLVTHDAVEAATLADRLVVVEDGRVTQTGSVDDITRRPRSHWAARLAGVNLYRGTARSGRVTLRPAGSLTTAEPVDGEVLVTVPPRAVALFRSRPDGTPRNVWSGEVDGLDVLGDRVRVHVGGALPVTAEVTPSAAASLDLAAHGIVWVAVKATELDVYPA